MREYIPSSEDRCSYSVSISSFGVSSQEVDKNIKTAWGRGGAEDLFAPSLFSAP